MSKQRIRGKITADLEIEVIRMYRSFVFGTPMVDVRFGGVEDGFVHTMEVGDTVSFPYTIELREC